MVRRSSLITTVCLLAFPLWSNGQDPTGSRTKRIQQMSVEDKLELRSKLDRYNKLSSEQKKELATVEERLSSHPDEELLRETMQRYYDWLKSLNAVDRAKLQSLPFDQRVAEIKRLMDMQEREQFEELGREVFREVRPSREDFSAISKWLENWVEIHQEEILSHEADVYKHEPRLEQWLKDAPPKRKSFVLWTRLVRQRQASSLRPSPEDFLDLVDQLEKDTRKRLEKYPLDRRRMLLDSMLRGAIFAHFRNSIDRDRLKEFYKTLPEQVQAELANLPPDEFDRRLRGEFYRDRLGGKSGGPPWDRDGRRDRGPMDEGRPPGPPPGVGPGGEFRERMQDRRGHRPQRRDDDKKDKEKHGSEDHSDTES